MEKTQVCSKCEKNKPVSNFHRRLDGYQYICKACKKPVDAAVYEKNRPSNRRRAYPRKPDIERLRTYKESNPCADCGHKFHFAAMDFDHLPGTVKLGGVGSLVQKESWAVVEREIAKCELVCSNCHRVRTYDRWHRSNTQTPRSE